MLSVQFLFKYFGDAVSGYIVSVSPLKVVILCELPDFLINQGYENVCPDRKAPSLFKVHSRVLPSIGLHFARTIVKLELAGVVVIP